MPTTPDRPEHGKVHPTIARAMQRCGAVCSPEAFHHAVNVTFHEFESQVYDEAHSDMWASLPSQFSLIVSDCVNQGATPEEISLLDIGCGTGLATDSILKSLIGRRIRKIDLLDTSKSMLCQAGRRAKTWPAPVELHEGLLDTLKRRHFDVIVTCSVLHHVPDLEDFLDTVRDLQRPGAIFVHMQDPNYDYLRDAELAARMAQVSGSRLPEWMKRLAPQRVFGRLIREFNGQQGQNYDSKVIRELVRQGVTPKPLSILDLYAITDIHAREGQGISIEAMRSWLPEYELLSVRSYSFYGMLRSNLPAALQKEEDRLIAARAPNGFHIGAAWRLT
jgi:2-polyprenyl-3-methyl-5-hydroxy-6-metoxy-1,4-benzoquinol methylase